MTFPGPFGTSKIQGPPLKNKNKNPKPGSTQVAWLGFGSIWEEIVTKWLENGPYELIFAPFGIESWSRVRFWGSRRSKMASFGGFAKISKNLTEFCVTIESGPWGHLNPTPLERAPECEGDPTI